MSVRPSVRPSTHQSVRLSVRHVFVKNSTITQSMQAFHEDASLPSWSLLKVSSAAAISCSTVQLFIPLDHLVCASMCVYVYVCLCHRTVCTGAEVTVRVCFSDSIWFTVHLRNRDAGNNEMGRPKSKQPSSSVFYRAESS